MKKMLIIISLLFSFTLFSAEVSGIVIKVIDGDTITIQDGNDKFKVRFAHIDAPEKAQEYGKESAAALKEFIFNQHVYVEFHEIDMYGRIIGTVYLTKLFGTYFDNVNIKMVSTGNAWWYEEYSKDANYLQLQETAKLEKLGLWKADNPMPPWEFRKMNKKGK